MTEIQAIVAELEAIVAERDGEQLAGENIVGSGGANEGTPSDAIGELVTQEGSARRLRVIDGGDGEHRRAVEERCAALMAQCEEPPPLPVEQELAEEADRLEKAINEGDAFMIRYSRESIRLILARDRNARAHAKVLAALGVVRQRRTGLKGL
jgi:hypothetical protein